MLEKLKIFRPLNLLIVYALVVLYSLLALELTPKGSFSFFSSFALSFKYALTFLPITAAGYLINDFYDQKIDLINRPEKKYILSKKQTNIIYILLNLVSITYGYLTFGSEFCIIFIVIPIWIMWMYSFSLKRLPIIGNITVSILAIMMPIGIVSDSLDSVNLSLIHSSIEFSFLVYLLSASFLLTFSREVIKDIEDLEGDREEGCKTFPVYVGEKFAAIVSGIIQIFLAIISFNFIKNYQEYFSEVQIVLFGLVIISLVVTVGILFKKGVWKINARLASLSIKITFILSIILGFSTLTYA